MSKVEKVLSKADLALEAKVTRDNLKNKKFLSKVHSDVKQDIETLESLVSKYKPNGSIKKAAETLGSEVVRGTVLVVKPLDNVIDLMEDLYVELDRELDNAE